MQSFVVIIVTTLEEIKLKLTSNLNCDRKPLVKWGTETQMAPFANKVDVIYPRGNRYHAIVSFFI